MSEDIGHDLGQARSPAEPALRQPPRFVPTLTHMVQPAQSARVEPAATATAAMPAAFAELLKDWPALGEAAVPTEPAVPAEDAPALGSAGGTNVDSELQAERIAQRAEALVLQRMPALVSGLVSSAVRDAMAEFTADEVKSPGLRKSI